MRVFLSWSGIRSKHVASCLREWLPKVIQSLEPWMSDEDIASGARWPSEVAGALEESTVGVVCLTPENQRSEWVLFEAGALSKTLHSNTYLVPYLTEMPAAQLVGPLAQFQAVVSDQSGTFKLLATLNTALEDRGIPQSTLDESFEVWWPRLQADLARLPQLTEPVPETRTDRDLLDEILENTREQLRRYEARLEAGAQVSASPPGLSLHYGIEVFNTTEGDYRWRIVRGQAVAVSDAAYASSGEASEAAASVRDMLAGSEIVEINDSDP